MGESGEGKHTQAGVSGEDSHRVPMRLVGLVQVDSRR